MGDQRKTTDTTKTKSGSDADSLFDGALERSYQAMSGEAATAGSTATAGAAASRDASTELQRRGVVGNLTVVDATDSASQAQKQRLAYVQATVGNFLPIVLAPENGKPDAAAAADISRRQGAIAAEAAKGVFGPETRSAYGQYLDWLEKKALPSTKRDLQLLNLPLNEPLSSGPSAPADDLHIYRNAIPDDAQLQRIDDAVKWAQAADTRVSLAQETLLRNFDGKLVETVKRLNLPEGWVEDMNRDHSRWRATVGMLTDRTLTARSNIEILDELRRAGGENLLAGVLTPGTSVTHDEQGKLTGVHLNLPNTWDLTIPENQRRATNLQELVNNTTALLGPAVPQLEEVVDHPERALSWGDTELKGTRGLFNDKGDFVGMLPKDAPVPAGQHVQDVNLLQSRFDVEERDGKIIVHQEVQAQSVPWWGYQNLIGVSNVGNKSNITREFAPTDSVIVRTAGGYEVRQARDLAGYKNWEMAKLYGEKALMGALDVGMVVSGAIETKAAIRASRMADMSLMGLNVLGRQGARVATAEGLEVSARMLSGQLAKGTLRTTVGITGILNNAGARESTFGESVNTARSVYFLADASLGLGSAGLRATRSLLGRNTETLASLTKPSIAGLTAGSRTESLYNITHRTFKASEYGFLPIVGSDLLHSAGQLSNDKNAHVFRAAEILFHDRPKKQN